MGRSFTYEMPVTDIILERLPLSLAFTFAAFALTWIIAVPIGIYSAVRQYSLTDYLATTVSFIGLAVPNFLLALGLAYLVFVYSGHAITSLYSLEFRNCPVDSGQGSRRSQECLAGGGGDRGGRHRSAGADPARQPCSTS